MKPAFLFLTRGNLNQPRVWDEFFRDQREDEYSVYVHAKEPDEVSQPFIRKHLIKEHIDTQYGHVSLVNATLLLLKRAFDDPANDRFILCSESCVPIIGFKKMMERLRGDPKSHIAPQAQVEIERWRSLKDPNYIPLPNFKKHHQWIVLNREVAKIFLEIDHTDLWQDVFAPDEHYFLNLLVKIGFPIETEINPQPTTFVNWDEPQARYRKIGGVIYKIEAASPKLYEVVGPKELAFARRRGCMLFRKVSINCPSGPLLESVRS